VRNNSLHYAAPHFKAISRSLPTPAHKMQICFDVMNVRQLKKVNNLNNFYEEKYARSALQLFVGEEKRYTEKRIFLLFALSCDRKELKNLLLLAMNKEADESSPSGT
jgi:hypothetical protein